ncbi:MAG: hypothetical protein IJD14_01845 [Christensenellaceae bacterium]|nr:hypothetical protein [Christensenellaceae bacterium]
MKIREIVRLLNAKILCGEDLLDEEVVAACGSDMMSDVLAYVKDQALLLTGLLNPQVIRTAMMMDMRCIVFVRSKLPDEETINLASKHHIVVLATADRMFEACGKLYAGGLGNEVGQDG